MADPGCHTGPSRGLSLSGRSPLSLRRDEESLMADDRTEHVQV